MRKSQAEQNSAEKPKIKSNTTYNLRWKVAHTSIKTEKDESLHEEFKSLEREGRDIRINTELNNSQIFHNHRMVDEQFRQLLQVMFQTVRFNTGQGITQYIDHLEILCQRVNINQETNCIILSTDLNLS